MKRNDRHEVIGLKYSIIKYRLNIFYVHAYPQSHITLKLQESINNFKGSKICIKTEDKQTTKNIFKIKIRQYRDLRHACIILTGVGRVCQNEGNEASLVQTLSLRVHSSHLPECGPEDEGHLGLTTVRSEAWV